MSDGRFSCLLAESLRVARLAMTAQALVCLAAGPAWAIRAPEDDQHRQPYRPEESREIRDAGQRPRAAEPPGAFFLPHQLRPIDLPDAPRNEQDIVEALRRYLDKHPERLGGLKTKHLTVSHVATVPGQPGQPAVVYVQFTQQLEGLEVEGTYVNFSVKLLERRSVVMDMHAKVYPKVALPKRTLRSQAAMMQNARTALSLSADRAQVVNERHRIRYLHGRWRRVCELRFAEAVDKAIVDEDTAETWAEEDRVYATIQGRVQGRGVLFDPIATGSNLPTLDLKDLKVTTTGGSASFTDAIGLFDFPTETAPTTVSAKLEGRWGKVTSVTSSNLSFSGAATPGVPLAILFNPVGAEELATAQVNGYHHTTFIHDWVKGRLSGPLPGIDISLPTKVNLSQTCNAFYDFASINFFKAGGGCINTAYDTVVYHEYGHFVDDKAGGITNGGLSEGWGDALAAYGTNQPLIGEGFFGAGTTIRTADNAYQYNPSDEVHALGQAWAGFAWHLRENLIVSQGEAGGIALAEQLVIPVFLANSPDIPSAVFQVLLRDDNDGDLSNGTPHDDEIFNAAAQHSIPIPENDSVPPTAVNDLAAQAAGFSRINLTWTATGDDGLQGTAATYDIRYATTPISSDAAFQLATKVSGVPKPKPSGSAEQFAVNGLLPSTTYYVAMKVLDNMNNTSPLSNLASATTQAGTVVLSEHFESGAPGWSATGLWHLSQARSNSPLTSETYNDGIDYDTGTTNSGTLVSPPIPLPAASEVLLVFFHWYETESFPEPFDVRRVQLSTNNGSTWTTLKQWDSRDPNQLFFAPFGLNLTPYVGQTIRLRFLFDTVDAIANTFEGWYVDDVMVFASINHAPVLDPIGNKTVNEGQLLTFAVAASDSDGDPLTYSADSLPLGASFNAATRTFAWTPGFHQAGNYVVTFAVSDGALSDSEPITITVLNVNRAPSANAGVDQTVSAGSLVTLDGSGSSDPDDDSLSFAWTQLSGPPVTLATPTSAKPTFTAPTVATATALEFKLTVSDGSLNSSDTSTVTISALPTNAFKGEYFDNKDFTNLKLIRTDAAINFDWGKGSPHAALGSNTFSVRWEGNWDFVTAGTYRVSATTNDGMRIWLDDVLILDKWFDHSKKKTYIVDRALSAGPHRIKVEYYENKKKAVARLSWTRQ